jgi:hypothetical protein
MVPRFPLQITDVLYIQVVKPDEWRSGASRKREVV